MSGGCEVQTGADRHVLNRSGGKDRAWGRAARQVIVSLTLTGKEHVHSIPIWKDRLPLALGAASLLAELRMNNEQRDDSEAELYSGPFGVAFALSVLITAAAVLWLF